tara:strand:- start:1191 stop:1796 length:606 start_codon:yes stop_codon:yes gene_type:complete
MEYKNEFKYFYWGPCLAKFILDDEFCKGLIKKGRLLKQDARQDLAGHLDKELKFTLEDRDWFLKKFSTYLNDYMIFLNEYHNKKFNVNCKLTDLWINYMKSGEFNPPHIHSQQLSFVIYLQVPEELKQEHKNYKGTDSAGPGGIKFINDFNNDILNIAEVPIFPKENECYIFPASLNHMVFPYKSNCERVSVSGNIEFIPK